MRHRLRLPLSATLTTLTALTATGLSLPSPTAHAAPAEQPVGILNGDFALPATKGDGPTTVAIDNWTGANQRYSPAASGRTDSAHGVALQKDGNTLRQRLRGVRTGAEVTVTYEDSPAVSKECVASDVENGQPYTVDGSGGQLREVTTAHDPGRVKGTAGRGSWTARTYAFTATENDPVLTFTSKVTNSRTHLTCTPMIADLRAVEVPTSVDRTVDRTALGTAEAYKGNEREKTLHNAAAACNGENACTFRPDTRTSFRFYGKARVIGEAFVNCTRNTVQHTRTVRYAERSHDSIAQTYADANLSLEEVARLPTTGDRAEDQKRIKDRPMAAQFALAYEKQWQRPWQWFSSDQRDIVETIQPGEVSWVELQPTRERVEGWFVSKKDDYRLHAVVDGPSRAVPDRLLQRTGPMSAAEKQRCAAERPMTTTPVGADSPASSTDKGLLEIPAPTSAGVRAAATTPLG
ncbi:hypothetical protein OG705_15270 [Streptomyces sp. NBC_00838]|uniref:hypothetical protein n=1 Tax=Streptomyces sp. NBC_00838 TaxID=2903680 RepID=UPI00386F9358|nr:hypothetical protein OG705_15270 [Streptomyces sp. NBC_00838]